MRGKGVKHGLSGALKTPYHYMSAKEKKKLNGEVEVFNMYETIIPFKEFELKDEETQRNMLIRWREIYTNAKIREELGITNSPFYDLVKKLNLPKKLNSNAGKTRKKREAKTKITALSPEMSSSEIKQEVMPETKSEVVKAMIVSNGLHLEYNGSFDVDTLNKLFTKLQLLIDGESNKYHISLSLSEITKD